MGKWNDQFDRPDGTKLPQIRLKPVRWRKWLRRATAP
jgi:hypothetical protein